MSRREPIRKEASGRYLVVIDAAGPGEPRHQVKRRFGTYKAARAWLSQTRMELTEQRFVRPQRITLAEHVQAWLPVLRTQVRESTSSSYARNLRLHVLPTLGTKPLQSIRPADLTSLYAQLLANGRRDHQSGGLSSTTVAYVHTIVGKCLEAAVRGELLVSNPARRAEVPRGAAKGDRHTMMRHAQVVRPQDSSWSPPDLHRRRDGARPADAERRAGPSAEQAHERLLVGAGYAEHDLLFCKPDGQPYHPDRFARVFTRQAARLELPAIRLHDLRHTWATLALLSGVHPKVVQERLGHTSISITLDIYSHVVPAMESDAAERVAALILSDHA